ncbi:capsular biosynthesis protein [Salipiger mucosus]|nr:capsular biosynthesis protein [Salipiger mucosus]
MRSFLFLQGPIGPFFKQLSDALKARGHHVHKVNFWGGDEAFFPDGESFTDPAANWPTHLLSLCRKHMVTDIVLFGDRRSYHEDAIESIAEANPDTRVWVFEEGYFRPNWITLDHYGVNARSSLPSSREELIAAAEGIETLPTPSQHSVTPWVREFLPSLGKYHAVAKALAGKYPHFQYHRMKPPLTELSGWMKTLAGRAIGHSEEGDIDDFRALETTDHFLAPLQLEGDFQIRKYSPFKGNAEFINFLIASFAKHADGSRALVIKSHPYDCRWAHWRSHTYRIAKQFGVADRVVFVHKCPVSEIVENCRGCVTINSSFGLDALTRGIPVKALGQAFWNFAPITNEGTLDRFWSAPEKPAPEAVNLMKEVVMRRTQFNGGFYSEQGRALCIQDVANTLSSREQSTSVLSEAPTMRLQEKRARRVHELGSTQARKKKLDLFI